MSTLLIHPTTRILYSSSRLPFASHLHTYPLSERWLVNDFFLDRISATCIMSNFCIHNTGVCLLKSIGKTGNPAGSGRGRGRTEKHVGLSDWRVRRLVATSRCCRGFRGADNAQTRPVSAVKSLVPTRNGLWTAAEHGGPGADRRISGQIGGSGDRGSGDCAKQ